MTIKEGTAVFRHILHFYIHSFLWSTSGLPAEAGQVRETVQNTGYGISRGIKANQASGLTCLQTSRVASDELHDFINQSKRGL